MERAEKLIIRKKLPTYQIGENGMLRPVMLMNEFQTYADMHASILGVGREYCVRNQIGWVLTHYVVDITEMPNETEEIQIITWPAKHEGLKAPREFEIRGSDDRLMVRATSQWVILNLATRRPVRLSDCLPEWGYIPERALDAEFEKLAEFESENAVEFRVRYDDIDANRHVNNAVYATWAMESLGYEFLDGHRLRKLKMNFKKEISAATRKIKVFYLTEGPLSRHTITSAGEDGAEIVHAVVECEWEKSL